MLNFLTDYLLQYRKVFIPHIGSVELMQSPARVDFVDKLIYPPEFNSQLVKQGSVSEHQLSFLSAATHKDEDAIKEELDSLGKELQLRMEEGSFTWEGIGTFSTLNSRVPFKVLGLEPIPAEKVQRANAQHQVLMGDQHVVVHQDPTTDPAYQELFGEKKKSKMWIAWVLLAIAILVIIYFLYAGNFTTYSSGLKTHP